MSKSLFIEGRRFKCHALLFKALLKREGVFSMSETAEVAYVFPGQGSQFAGMGKDLYDRFDSAKAVFDQADEVLKFPLSKLCFEGPEEELRLTINAQPALVTVSIACLKAVQEEARAKFDAPDY